MTFTVICLDCQSESNDKTEQHFKTLPVRWQLKKDIKTEAYVTPWSIS